MQANKNICILGSANFDTFLYVPKIPAIGETIQSNRFLTANGGKGANQAVAVGKLAGHSSFLGQVGNDDHMKSLKLEMEAANVQLKWRVLQHEKTGKAYIYVDSTTGDNSIVIYGGANIHFANEDNLDLAEQFKKVVDESDYLLLQKEIPMTVNVAAAKYAHSKGKIVILDCGGRDDNIPEELLNNITYISPNETELLRIDPTIEIKEGEFDLEQVAIEIREKLIKKHPNLKVLLKLGSRGSAVITSDLLVRGEVVTSINKNILQDFKILDTVGAGDCFTGAFAVKHSEVDWSNTEQFSSNYRKAMEFGNSAAFICITRQGAMPSMPLRCDVDFFIKKYEIQ